MIGLKFIKIDWFKSKPGRSYCTS